MRIHQTLRHRPLTLAALGAVALLGAHAVGGPRAATAGDTSSLRLETIVPGRSLAFVSLEDIGTWGARWKKTGLGRLFEDPEMKAFAEPIGDQIEQLLKEGAGGAGAKDEKVLPPIARKIFQQVQGLSGQSAVALVEFDEQKGPVL